MLSSWVAVQLHPSDEGIAEDLLIDSLRSIAGDALEVFIPTLTFKDKRGSYSFSLFDGYVFVRGALRVGDYSRLDNSPYVNQVLMAGGRVAYIADDEIDAMRRKLQDMVPSEFSVGDMLFVEKGLFSGLRAKVIAVEGEKLTVEVYMPLGSLTKLTRIPKMFARQLTEDEQNADT